MSMLTLALSLFLLPQEPAPRIEWQRSLADALQVQSQTGQPLLLCVNTDGEVFCDRFAETTYRDPAFVALTKGYVCVIASPDRHTERDYDGQGRRIECPRFPGCTCSEHQNVEPELFARWFRGERYAPRHVAVPRNGEPLFDRFLDGSMQTAIDAIEKARGPVAEEPLPAGFEALVRRADARSRRAAEAQFAAADTKGRLALLSRCAEVGVFPIDVLRMALRDDDDEVFLRAASALAAIGVKECAIDIQDALARAQEEWLQASLTSTLARIAEGDEALTRIVLQRAAGQRGLATGKPADAPTAAPGDPALDSQDRDEVEAALDRAEAALRQAKDDPRLQLQVVRATVALGLLLSEQGEQTGPLLLEDARRMAARSAAPAGCELLGAQAIAEHMAGRADAAAELARRAMAAPDADAALAADGRFAAALLRAAAMTQVQGIYQRASSERPPADEEAIEAAARAFTLLLAATRSTADDARNAAAFLAHLGLRQQARATLAQALMRWPWSRELHDDYRRRLAVDLGPKGLLDAYANSDEGMGDAPTAYWFAGYAALVAAEMLVQDQRGDEALSAYRRAIGEFTASGELNADYADSARHFVVLAKAGAALQEHLAGDDEQAVSDLLAAKALRPASWTDQDGLQRTPEGIARRVRRELAAAGKAELAARLD